MNDSHEERGGGWRIGALLFGSINISGSIVLYALIVGALLAAACNPDVKPGQDPMPIMPTPPNAGTPPAGAASPDSIRRPAGDTGGISFSQGAPPAGDPVEVWRVDNLLRVFNGGTPTAFTLAKDYWVTEVGTYHYNEGKGKEAGTLAVKASNGTMYGPWQTELDHGWYWRAKPNMWIPAGSYTVIDSDPSTWSQNDATRGQGIAWMFGKPAP